MSGQCVARDCDRPSRARGLCDAHYRRWLRGTDINTPIRVRDGTPWVHSNGYMVMGAGSSGKMVYVHRVVMAEKLGRPLRPGEAVHHINGCKTDNRPENLELWSSTQPAGQRVAELVEWARDILRTYGRYFPEGRTNGISEGDP